MELVPAVVRLITVAVLATLLATAASPVASSAATPMGPEPVVMVFVTVCWSSSTTEADALPLLATTALCRRDTTATPSGFAPTAMVLPVPVLRSMSAVVLQPNRLTIARSCWESTATPAGDGAVEQPLPETSTCWMTEKSAAFETELLVVSSTSNAKRRAWVRSEEESPPRLAVIWRSVMGGMTSSRIPSRRGTELLVKPLPIIVIRGSGLGGFATLDRDDVAMMVLGLVSTIESGR